MPTADGNSEILLSTWRQPADQDQVHNLIAQEDSLRNIEVAKDSKIIAGASKRDSGVMKMLAVLGTLFLPGTFISVSLKYGTF